VNIKSRVLFQTFSAALAFTLLLSVMFFIALARIRNRVLNNAGTLGSRAAQISAAALEEQVTGNIARIASSWAVILDERLLKIENHTRMTADITDSIYSDKWAWHLKPLSYAAPGRLAPREPYIHTAPGVALSAVRAETDLAGNIGDILRQITVIDRAITTSAISGESGYIIAMDAFPWPSENLDPRLAPWYQGAKEKGDLYWTEIYADLRGRGPVVSCAMPFYDRSGGKRVFRGVACSTLLLSDFTKIINSSRAGRNGYIFLLDGSGTRLFSEGSVDVRIGKDGQIEGMNYLESGSPQLRNLALSMTLGASGMTRLEIDDIPVYAAYAPVETLGWSLGVTIPVEEVNVPAWRIGETILGISSEARGDMNRYIALFTAVSAAVLLCSLAVIAVLAARFTSSLTGPILALNEGVHEVSGGNLEREVSIKTGDELEELANSFNTMTSRLRLHIGQIARATAEKERIATELDVAARIQTSLLPRDFPPFPGYENEFGLYAAVYPAKEVGGDFYDFFFIDNDHFAVVIADVSGKGIPAALFMIITKTLVKNHLQSGEAPGPALQNINRQLCGNNQAEMFVTLWLGVLEISSGRLEYVNAGHNPPLLKSGGESAPGKDFEFLALPSDLVLAGMEDTAYQSREIVLGNGDTLFLYTDGVTEAGDIGERFYGKERLREFMNALGGLPPRELITRLRSDIGAFSRGIEQSDDITMLVLRFGRETGRGKMRSLTLDADAGLLGELTGFVAEILENASCPGKVRGQIELAIEEIFVNIALYAYHGEQGRVTVECGTERVPGGVTLTLVFSDRGASFNPLEREDPDIHAPLEERSIGGLGLLLVKRTMDRIEYSHDGERNRLVIQKSWQVEV
jgi:sigma-B regulation protein RsbU (phosphoserine phosphatase)